MGSGFPPCNPGLWVQVSLPETHVYGFRFLSLQPRFMGLGFSSETQVCPPVHLVLLNVHINFTQIEFRPLEFDDRLILCASNHRWV